MGTSGVPLTIPKNIIINAIKKRNGVLTAAAKDLDCSRPWLIQHVNSDPELKDILAKERNAYDEYLCDKAESVLVYALNKCETDLSNALGASKFILNNKGKNRGYSQKADPTATTDPLEGVRDSVREIQDERRRETIIGSSLEDEQPILDKEPPGNSPAL